MATCPLKFDVSKPSASTQPNEITDRTLNLKNCCGKIYYAESRRLRSMGLEIHGELEKIRAICCSEDGLSSRLVEEARFPVCISRWLHDLI